MKQEVRNFGRFYALFGKLATGGNDRDEVKRSLVLQHTWNRTDSLREMTVSEYKSLCASLEVMTGEKEALRKARSLALKLMQQNGVDTTDWNRVNEFCRHPKIAGKDFRYLTMEELEALDRKLRMILKKGGLSGGTAEHVGLRGGTSERKGGTSERKGETSEHREAVMAVMPVVGNGEC